LEYRTYERQHFMACSFSFRTDVISVLNAGGTIKLGKVELSKTSGYYVCFFRSKKNLAIADCL
jgi:hypothetical protein